MSQGSVTNVPGLLQQFGLVEDDYRADTQAVNGDKVAFNEIAAGCRPGCNDNQCLAEVGGNGLFALPCICTGEYIVPLQDAGYHGRLPVHPLNFNAISAQGPADGPAVFAIKLFAITQLDDTLFTIRNQDECSLLQKIIPAGTSCVSSKSCLLLYPCRAWRKLCVPATPKMKMAKGYGMDKNKQQRLIWLDLEMTGLDTDRDSILEIATIITDSDLNELAEGPVLAIKHPESELQAMDDWNTEHHQASGLWRRVLDSQSSMRQAEQGTLGFLGQWTEEGSSPLCGNSICQDRRFLHRLMPELERWFHYRNLDVSSLKELAARWAPGVLEGLNKQNRHQALFDIRESIEELRYYRQFMGDFSGLPRGDL